MKEQYAYLIINIAAVLPPFLLSFDKKVAFYKQFYRLFPSLIITAFIFVAWDVFFTKYAVWGFNERYLTGIDIIHLPMEEVLFFFTIPYACIFTYEVYKAYFPDDGLTIRNSNVVSIILSIVLFVLGILYLNNLYTSITFIFTATLLAVPKLLRAATFLRYFFPSYLVILVPFFIVNGLLTGSMVDEPIVWYNENEIIGIRIFTIPVEDSVYGFLLLYINLIFYEKVFRKKFSKS